MVGFKNKNKKCRPDSLSFICKVLPDAWGKWPNYDENIFPLKWVTQHDVSQMI